MLPGPDKASEDAWIEQWMFSEDVDGLIAAITDAMDARRPQLAARLVGLLDDSVDIVPDSPLGRAQHAAKFFLVQPQKVEYFQAFEDAWIEARRTKIRKVKKRMRDRSMGRPKRKR